ncbi:hypothetical protein DFH06DRAFT_1398015 [Mycena polygramma]|nr:hypothetical protein DFH06DRAFT_1398015 [Mycena polygramma]
MVHLNLISRIDGAIHAALPSVQNVSVQDYRAVGEVALNQCILLHFLRSDTPFKYRGTITARILSPGTLQLFLQQSKLTSDDLDADPADTVFIFVGALAACRGDVHHWFGEAFVPLIDSAVSEYTIYLEDCDKISASEDGGSPAKRPRRDNDQRKLAHHSKAVDRLIGMAASLGNSTQTDPDDDYFEELQVLTTLHPASLLEGLSVGPFQSATTASFPATLNDDYSEEQEVFSLLDPAGLGQDFPAVSSSALSGVFVALTGAAQETARWPRSSPKLPPSPDANWGLLGRPTFLMAAKRLSHDFPGPSTTAFLLTSGPVLKEFFPQAQRVYLPVSVGLALHLRPRLSFLDIKSNPALCLSNPSQRSDPLHAPRKPQTPHTQDDSPILSVLILHSLLIRHI